MTAIVDWLVSNLLGFGHLSKSCHVITSANVIAYSNFQANEQEVL